MVSETVSTYGQRGHLQAQTLGFDPVGSSGEKGVRLQTAYRVKSPKGRFSALLVWSISVASLPFGTCFAASYYVAPNGDDTESGSVQRPWRTLDRALQAVGPGDLVILATGTYSVDSTTRRHGQSGLPITISGPENRSAVITGRLTVLHSHYMIRYLHFSGTDLRLEGSGANDNVIEYNRFMQCSQGVYMREKDAPPNGGPSRNIIRDNEFAESVGNGAVVTVGVGNVVEGNDFHDLGGYDALRVWGVGTIIRQNSFRRIITGSEAGHTDHADIIQTFRTSSGTWARDVIFERNIIVDCSAQFGNLEGGGENNGNWIFRNNILVRSRPQMNIYIPRVQFYNNTVYDSTWSVGFRFTSAPDRGAANYGRVINNLFIRVLGYYSVASDLIGFEGDFNCVTGRDDGTVSGFSENHGINGGYAPSAIFSDAEGGDVSLVPGAVVIGRGTLLSEVQDDFTGKLRSLKTLMDLGAYMYLGDAVPAAPRNLRVGYLQP